ncbi:MAG: cystathionine gamma-synthase family protein [Gammaproteobacteria bacterium]|nr:cystathionine gamma-synthase family protein [Gammaproteobacteria bacterium]MDE0225016.1 cystathionine gamma-synthase family protein [Gammaproteobacteria bacterium]
MDDSREPGFTTSIVHSDRWDPIEHGSMHKPVHSTVAYGYEETKDLVGVFQGTHTGYAYSRQVNPTVTALERKLDRMERGIATVCFGTGMAAIGSIAFSLLRRGDHIVSSWFLFGNTNSLFRSFEAQGIEVTFVDATDVDLVAEAIRPETRLVFVETIANPRTQVSDMERIGALCRERGLIYVVDNTMTSPWLFQPVDVDASLIVNSLTKYIGGHGNALGGAVTETGLFDWTAFDNIYPEYRSGDPHRWGIQQLRKKGLRDFGAALAPEAAHHLAVGSETLALRMERQCDNTAALVQYLEADDRVSKVYYPGLPEHPQHALASRLFRRPGAIFSFELTDDVDPFAFLDRMNIVVRSTNLGDNRTLAIPVAHTIYFELGAERRASMGIADSLIRISVGIEDVDDLIDDFEGALAGG